MVRPMDSDGGNGYVPPDLEIGVDYSGEENVRSIVERELAAFAAAVRSNELDVVLLHQDAFASGYTHVEFLLLGLAVKYAGLHGQSVTFHGKNGETC